MPGEEKEFSWNIETHQHREHSTDWYWTLGVGALAGAGASIFFGNVLLAAIIVIGAGSIGILAARGPREHAVRITERGISIDGTRYPYTSVHSFFVEHNAEKPHLFVTMTGVLFPHLSLPLNSKEEGEKLTAFLKPLVLEEEQGPRIGDHLAEIFGL